MHGLRTAREWPDLRPRVDGGEYSWARVLAFEPPNRLVFSWDISPQWQLETDLQKTSEVEVRVPRASACGHNAGARVDDVA